MCEYIFNPSLSLYSTENVDDDCTFVVEIKRSTGRRQVRDQMIMKRIEKKRPNLNLGKKPGERIPIEKVKVLFCFGAEEVQLSLLPISVMTWDVYQFLFLSQFFPRTIYI